MTLQARYTILRKITDGGTAEILLATQHGAHGFEKPVVLKRIFPAFYADPQFRNMLVDEAHIAMSLNHSNIVQVLDLGEADGQYVLALELVDGWTLDAVLRRARALKTTIPPALALYMTAEVCRALAYAHAKVGSDGKPLGIVHRDISPHNLLLSEQGEVKLTDFGIAKAHNRRESSLGNIIKGKIAYMSPEQASGAPIDARSDLFSVGTMLYVMVCRRYPFDAPTDLEVLLLVKEGAYEPPEKALPGLNPEIYRVIKRAMSKSPADRYQRADEMLVDVEHVMRVAFHAVGQTELKRWLQDLSMRDGVPPLMRTFVLPSSKGTSAGKSEGGHQAVSDVVSIPAPVNLPPPAPGAKPGSLGPPAFRGGATRKPPPPRPAAATAGGHLANVGPVGDAGSVGNASKKTIAATTANVGAAGIPTGSAERPVAENSAGTKIPTAAEIPPPAPRKSSSWVAEAVLASAQRAGTTPPPPVGKPVPPPPVPMDTPSGAPTGTVADADAAEAPRRGRQNRRTLIIATGIAFVAVLGGGIALRTWKDGSRDEASVAGSNGAAPATVPTTTATQLPTVPGAATGPTVPGAATGSSAPGAATGPGDPSLTRDSDATAALPDGMVHEAKSAADSPGNPAPAIADKTNAESTTDSDSEADAGAAPTPVPKATVLLSSSPPGAQVATGRRSLGTTPVSVKMKVGRMYSLTFTRDGYRPVTKQFRVTEFPDQQVSAVLRREVLAQKPLLEPPIGQPPPPPPKPPRNWFQRMFGR